MLYQITSKHFCAGLITHEKDNHPFYFDEWCILCAPILWRKFYCKNFRYIKIECKRLGWKLDKISKK